MLVSKRAAVDLRGCGNVDNRWVPGFVQVAYRFRRPQTKREPRSHAAPATGALR
jgi:hypothetical protein